MLPDTVLHEIRRNLDAVTEPPAPGDYDLEVQETVGDDE